MTEKKTVCPVLTLAASILGAPASEANIGKFGFEKHWETQLQTCLGQGCQLWWFCKGDELSKKATFKLGIGKGVK